VLVARRKYGEQACRSALDLIAAAFSGQILKAGAPIFRALIRLEASGETPDRHRLLETLQTHAQAGWASRVTGLAKGVEERASVMKDAILAAYNVADRQVCLS